jgi:hypothetical protein
MTERSPASEQAISAGPDFEAKLDELLDDYRHIVWQSYQLPFFSLRPTFIFLWHYLIALFGLVLELVILPYTLVALALRLAGAKLPLLIPFSKRVWYAIVYAWRGEIFGSIVMRPVVRWLVKSHVARRLRALSELIATSEQFSTEARARLGGKIAEAQARFPVRELSDFFKDSLIPALAFGAISFATDLVGDEEQKRVLRLVGYAVMAVIVFYGASTVVAGFPVKRGLFLGRDVKGSPFPGGVPGQGLYALERQIFSIFPVRPKEVSLDFGFAIIASALTPIFALVGSASEMAEQHSINASAATNEAIYLATQVGTYVLITAVYIVMRIRRGILKRN